MIRSVSQLPRVEHFLFQKVDELGTKFITCISLDPLRVKEEILDVVKGRINTVVHANSHGPERWDLYH